jgi:hypothetical protein
VLESEHCGCNNGSVKYLSYTKSGEYRDILACSFPGVELFGILIYSIHPVMVVVIWQLLPIWSGKCVKSNFTNGCKLFTTGGISTGFQSLFLHVILH